MQYFLKKNGKVQNISDTSFMSCILLKDITAAYLDYANNYLTLANFAASRGWSEITASTIIKAGKELQNETINRHQSI